VVTGSISPSRAGGALGGALSAGDTVVEVDAARTQSLTIGQSVGLSPRQYRLFANA
jgi:hypothetical protein